MGFFSLIFLFSSTTRIALISTVAVGLLAIVSIPFFIKMIKHTNKGFKEVDELLKENDRLDYICDRAQQGTLPSGKLNYQNYAKINDSTTIAQVLGLLGEGKEVFSGQQNGSEIRIIVWEEVSMPACVMKTITIKLQDGRVIEKSQSGL